MRIVKPRSLIYLPALLAVFLYSCTPQSCLEETEALVKATLYDFTTLKNVAPDSITIYGMGMAGNNVYDNEKNLKVARLPLNPSADSSVFIVIINGITDTLTFRHTTYPHLISKECGYTLYHEITGRSFTSNGIDSLPVRKATITTVNEENIRIYY